MQYAALINAISQAMSNDARTFTRYNKPAEKEELEAGGISFMNRSCKMVCADYDNSTTSFTLRFLQIASETVVPTKEALAARIAEDDATFKQFATTTDMDLNDLAAVTSQALEHSGMNGMYNRPLRYLMKVIQQYQAKDRGQVLIGSSTSLNCPCVALFVQLEESVVIIQIVE